MPAIATENVEKDKKSQYKWTKYTISNGDFIWYDVNITNNQRKCVIKTHKTTERMGSMAKEKMKKKKLWILLIVVLFVCSLTSVLFNYKNIKRNIEIAKEEQVEKERKEEMLKQDLISPVLILKQDKLIMYQGDELNYKSFIKEATDNLEGDLTDRVKYTKIDTSKTGEFYVDYEVSDSASNVIKARLLVIIREKPNFKD